MHAYKELTTATLEEDILLVRVSPDNSKRLTEKEDWAWDALMIGEG